MRARTLGLFGGTKIITEEYPHLVPLTLPPVGNASRDSFLCRAIPSLHYPLVGDVKVRFYPLRTRRCYIPESLVCPLYLVRVIVAGSPPQGRESRASNRILREGDREPSVFRPDEEISIPLTRVCAISQGICDVVSAPSYITTPFSSHLQGVCSTPGQAGRGTPDNATLAQLRQQTAPLSEALR